MRRGRRRLALIGGLAPAATAFYQRELQALLGGGLQEIQPRNLDKYPVLRAVSRGEWPRLAKYLARLMDDPTPCDVAAIASITAHACAPQLFPLLNTRFVDAIDCISDAVFDAGARRVALFGARLTMETDLFGRLTDTLIVRPAPEDIRRLWSINIRIGEAGEYEGGDVEDLSRIVERLRRSESIDAVILAGANFSIVGSALHSGVQLIDGPRCHIQAIASALTTACSGP